VVNFVDVFFLSVLSIILFPISLSQTCGVACVALSLN
jgi:hypothetical protein